MLIGTPSPATACRRTSSAASSAIFKKMGVEFRLATKNPART
jgi:hypothetical protein